MKKYLIGLFYLILWCFNNTINAQNIQVVEQQISTFPVIGTHPIVAYNSVNNKLYFFGQLIPPFTSNWHCSDKIRMFNLLSNSWDSLIFNLPYKIFDNVRTSYFSNHFYLSPGFEDGGSGGWGQRKKMIDLDLTANMSFETTHQFSNGNIWNIGSIEVNGKIYFFGGWNGGPLNSIFEYSPASNTFLPVASMIHTANEVAAIYGNDGWIYLFSHYGYLERFNPLTYQVQTMSVSLPTSYTTCFWHISSENSIYFFSPDNPNQNIYKYNYANNILTNTGLTLSGNFERNSIIDSNDPYSIYMLKFNTGYSINNPDPAFPEKLVKLTLCYKPTINLGNDTTLAQGSSLTLNAGNTGSTYLWNTNDTTQTINVNSSGTYWVKVTNSGGCYSMDTIVVDFTANNTTLNDTTICKGETVTLTASGLTAGGTWEYFQDFENTVGSEWSDTNRLTYNSTKELGPFCSQSINLNLSSLPAHDSVEVSFDLYIFDSWDGNYPNYKDFWSFFVNNDTIINTTFSNLTGAVQSYPQNYPSINPERTGAFLINLPNRCHPCNCFSSSIYKIVRKIPNNSNSLQIIFKGIMTQNGGVSQDVCDESWGLDNVKVKLINVNSTPQYLWSTGATTASITVSPNQTTNYTVTVTNGSTTFADSATVNVLNPQINNGQDTTICKGESVVLTAKGLTNQNICSKSQLPSNLQQGLVAFYPFCGNANDESGNANNGTVNGATLTTDRFGNANSAYSFNGSTDYINITNYQSFNFGINSFSISSWFKTAFSSSPQRILSHGHSNWSSGFLYGLNWSTSKFSFGVAESVPSNSSLVNTMNSFDDNNWHNAICVVDKTNNKLMVYVDGNLQSITKYPSSGGTIIGNYLDLSTILNATANSNSTVNIGTKFINDEAFNGKIDDINIYNRALSASEIQQLYTLGTATSASYLWSTNDTTQSITVTPNQTTTYTLTVTNVNISCLDTITVNVLNPHFSLGNDTTICQGQSLILNTNQTFSSYQWSTGDTTQNITINSDGVYWLKATNANGCSFTDSLNVTLNNTSIHISEYSSNPNCDTTQLQWATWNSVNSSAAQGTISSGINISVNMSSGGLFTTGGMFSGGNFPSQFNVPINSTSIANTNAGVFTFCFSSPVTNPQIALASIGAPAISVQINTSAPYQIIWSGIGMNYPNNTTLIGIEGYTIIRFPGTFTCLSFNYLQNESYCNIAFGIQDTNCQASCPGLYPVTLIASGASNYTWSPSLGLNSTTGSVVQANPLISTTYHVTGTNNLGCTNSDSVLVKVLPVPIANWSADTVCLGYSTHFTDLSQGSPSQWHWNFGDGDTSIIQNPIHIYTSIGNYLVSLIVKNGSGCTDTLIKTALFINPPVINLGNDTTICQGQSKTLSVGSGYTSYIWSTGATTQQITVQNTGTYWVKAISNQGCTVSDTINLTFLPVQSNIIRDTILCLGQSVIYNPGAGYTNHFWSTGATTPSLNVNLPGTFWLQVKQPNGCVIKDTAIVKYDSLNIVVSSFTNPTCYGGNNGSINTTTTGLYPNYTYSWNTTPVINTANISNRTAGNYTVTVTDSKGCTKSVSKTLTAPNPVAVSLGNDTSICQGQNLNLQATQVFTSYLWSTGATTQSINVNAQGTYWLKGTNSSGCNGYDTINITVNPVPVIQIAPGNPAICKGDSVTLQVSSNITGTTFNWSNGNNSSSITVSPLATVNYTVIGSKNTCKDTATVNVTVNPVPVVTISPANPSVCKGEAVSLTASSNLANTTFLWNNNSANTSINVSPNTNTNYFVVGSLSTCKDTAFVTVTTKPLPVLNVTADKNPICEGETVKLTANSDIPATTYVWSNTSTAGFINVSPVSTSYYFVTGTASNCHDTAGISIVVISKQSIDLGEDRYLCAGDEVNLTAGNLTGTYLWSNGSNSGTLTLTEPGVYWLRVDNNGCIASDTIEMKKCSEIWVPNVFTPNGDGTNEIFKPVTTEIQKLTMYIYNRWGEMIFETSDVNGGWDGKLHGNDVPTGVYFWLIRYNENRSSALNIEKEIKGSVTLLR